MEESNKHINQKPDGNYPKPGVSVGDAWANMKDMLDSEMPADATSTATNTFCIQALKFLLPLIIVAGSIYLFLAKNDKTKSQTTTKSSYNRQSNFEKNDDSHEKDLKKLTIEKEKSEKNITKPSNDDASGEISLRNVESKKTISDKLNSNNLLPKPSPENTFPKRESIVSKAKKHASNNSTSLKVKPKNPAKKTTRHDLNEKEPDKTKSARNSLLSNNVDQRRTDVSLQEQQSDLIKTEKNYSFSNRKKTNSNVLKTGNSSFSTPGKASNNLSVLKIADIKILSNRKTPKTNALKEKFEAIPIKEQVSKPLNQVSKKQNTKALLSGLHVGLQWNTNLPLKNYRQFFTGTSQSGSVYTLFIPGIWIGKTFNNGSMLMLKVNPYNQYFGNDQQIDSSSTTRSDSSGNVTKNILDVTLLKTSGSSAGLQYVQRINSQWSVGLGAQIYWQNQALLGTRTINSRDGKVLSDSLLRVGRTSDNWKLIRPYFITGNLEILYTWQKLQFGAVIMIPVTSMTDNSKQKLRPANGQLLIRWKIR